MPSLVFSVVDADEARRRRAADHSAIRVGAGESLGSGIKRIAADQLGEAADRLAHPADGDVDGAVHRVRKTLKRVRALARLVRDTVGHPTYREMNVVLRDSGRLLAPVRDGAVMVDVLDRLVERYGLSPASVAATRARLVQAHVAARSAALTDPVLIPHVLTTLRVARQRFAAWPADEAGDVLAVPDHFDGIAAGVTRVYRRGRAAMARATTEHSDAAFHTWRKRVKYLRYQMETLEAASPEVGDLAITLDSLGEMLGEEHDLAVFRSVMSAGTGVGAARRRLLCALATAEQVGLRRESEMIGAEVYAERPGAFTRRIGGHWDGWRSG